MKELAEVEKADGNRLDRMFKPDRKLPSRLPGLVLIALLVHVPFGLSQAGPNRYEVEILTNPNPGKKDTRQVNAVLIFDTEGLRIQSRRSNEVFKDFKYSEIKSAEHSFTRKPRFSVSRSTAIALTVFTGLPFFLLPGRKEKHWLTIVTDGDFAVMKIENDNYRMIKNEFVVRKIDITSFNEAKR
ncbi:MAG: hypothetical protein AB7F88_19520 [Pyrinomonadaceae bacterium]